MDKDDRERMANLLRKNRRKLRIPDIVQAWAMRGVSASPLADERQQELLADFRVWRHSDHSPLSDLQASIAQFLDELSVIVVVDYDVNEEPALLLPVHSLSRSEDDLRAIYPDGFVLVREGAAMTIDFEEQPGQINVSYAMAP